MARRSLFFAVVFWAGVATAAPFPLPQGARWVATATSAGQFAREAGTLLEQAGRQSSALSAHGLGLQLERSFALPLMEASRLEAAGVDLTQPWQLFEKNGATYLTVSVRDAAPLTALLDDWATKRLLKREESKSSDPKGTVVTFARSAGARPATGYLVAKGRLVLLVTPGEKQAGLAEAWRACEEATPVAPPVSGTLLVWLGNAVPFRDGWLAFTARTDGIDLSGVARKVEPGWLVRTPERSDWVRALTDPSDGLPGDPPARLRLSAGVKTITSLAASIAGTGVVSEPMEQWIQSLSSLGPGPMEAIARSVDVSVLQSGSTGNMRSDLLLVTRPQLKVEDRPEAAISKKLDAARSALCKPKSDGPDALHSTCPDSPLTITRSKGTLSLSWGRTGEFEIPPPAPKTGATTCAAGIPVASARLDLAAIPRGTKGLGLLDALSNDALAGLYAFATQYGAIMRASHPATALVCADRDGRMTISGQWRFAPR